MLYLHVSTLAGHHHLSVSGYHTRCVQRAERCLPWSLALQHCWCALSSVPSSSGSRLSDAGGWSLCNSLCELLLEGSYTQRARRQWTPWCSGYIQELFYTRAQSCVTRLGLVLRTARCPGRASLGWAHRVFGCLPSRCPGAGSSAWPAPCSLLGYPAHPALLPLNSAAFQALFISCAPAPAAPSAAPCPRGGAGTRPGPGACPRPRLRAPGGSALQERGGSAAPRRCRAPSSGGTPTTDVLMYETWNDSLILQKTTTVKLNGLPRVKEGRGFWCRGRLPCPSPQLAPFLSAPLLLLSLETPGSATSLLPAYSVRCRTPACTRRSRNPFCNLGISLPYPVLKFP